MHAMVLLAAIVLAAPTDLADQVRELVTGLNSDALSDRAAAEQSLVKLGPPALGLLPDTTDQTPPEVAQRLSRVRQALEQAQADAAAQPSLVTLIGEDLPLTDVIARIAQQTDNKIVDYRHEFGEEVTDPRLKLNLEKIPFWPAIDEVLDQAKLTVYDFGGGRGLFLINRPAKQLPRKDHAFYAGPFRIAAKAFEASRELQQPRNHSLKLFINIEWEPRLRPIAIRQPFGTIKAVGTGDVAIDVTSTKGETQAEIPDNASSVEMQIPLELPPRNVAQITSLKGQLKVLVPGPVQAFRFDRLPIVEGTNRNAKVTKVEQRKAGVTVTVDEVRKNNDVWEVRTRVRFDRPGDSLESFRNWILRNQVYLVDAKQEQTMPGAYEQTRQAENEVGIAYLFDLPNGPNGLSLVYQTPSTIFELPIEYELRDLALP
jgi:hypothetical protein